jgi:hypothetical protein
MYAVGIMSDLTPKDIANWHRKEAKKFEDIAKRHYDMAAIVEAGGALGTIRKNQEVVTLNNYLNSDINAAQLEAAVQEKSGRIGNMAHRLSTSIEKIEGLLEPNSRVYLGDRGWLRVRE